MVNMGEINGVPTVNATISGSITVTTTATERWNFCPGCGKKLEADWNNCAGCGRAAGQFASPWHYIQQPYYPYYPFAYPSTIPPAPIVTAPPIITWSTSGGIALLSGNAGPDFS